MIASRLKTLATTPEMSMSEKMCSNFRMYFFFVACSDNSHQLTS